MYIVYEISPNNIILDNSSDEKFKLIRFYIWTKIFKSDLKVNPYCKRKKWGQTILRKITGLFVNDALDLDERPLLADEIIPAKLGFKN